MIPLGWHPRDVPLEPVGALGRGPVAAALGRRVLDAAPAYEGVVGDGLFVLLGPDLPWVDGVTYLGRHPDAPALLLDTRLAPDLPASWLIARFGNPIVLLPDLVVPLGELAPLHPPALQAWLAGR